MTEIRNGVEVVCEHKEKNFDELYKTKKWKQKKNERKKQSSMCHLLGYGSENT